MGQSDVPLPSAFGFLDVRLYLTQWFDAKREQIPHYTYTNFARRANCSPGHVRNVMNGQRKLLGRFVDGFVKALKLEGHEAVYFSTLTRYSNSTSVFERALLLRELAGILVDAKSPMPEDLAYACWLDFRNMAVLEAAHSPSFRDDPNWLAETLQIPPALARDALLELKAAGLLKPGESGGFRPCKLALVAPPMADPLVERLHRHGVSSAVEATSGTPDDRRLAVLTAPVLVGDMAEVFSVAQGAFHRMQQTLTNVEVGMSAGPGGSRLYALQIAFAPVSGVVPQRQADGRTETGRPGRRH